MKITFGKVIIFLFIALVLIGAYGYATKTVQDAIINVTHAEFIKEVEKAQNQGAKMVQRENGSVYLETRTAVYQTKVNPNDNDIKDLIQKYNVGYEYVKDISFSSVFLKIIAPGLLLVIVFSYFSKQSKTLSQAAEVGKANNKKSKMPTATLGEVGGLSLETKEEVKQIIEIFKGKNEAEKFGVRPSKAALLYGPPGTGKTLLAKAIANALQANFYSVSGSSFVEMFVGVGAKRARELFAEARKNAPSFIFIDEIDAVAGKRGIGVRNEERESTLNEILTQLDGVESNEDVFLIGATNRLDILDPAILRPGRFDHKLKIDLPDLEGRKEIIDIHIKNKKLGEEVRRNLPLIAKTTTGCSGADIEALFDKAAKHAYLTKKSEIDMEDVNYALDIMVLGNQTRRTMDEQTKLRVAYHEAGHALVSVATDPSSVRKATIVPRGEALGYVASVPKELDLATESELTAKVAMILAGGAAEIKKFGNHSIGVGGDVEQAKAIIERMVDLGMGEGGYNLKFNKKNKETAMQTIFQNALDHCNKILREREAQFEDLALLLLEKETVSGEEIERVVYARKNEAQTSAEQA